MRRFFSWTTGIILLLALGFGLWYGVGSAMKEELEYELKTEIVERQNLCSAISASGTVEPEELVNVGAQVSGKIMNFGVDADGKAIDYRSKVTKGMLLAKIDDVLYESALREAKATKIQSEVAILSAQASLKQAIARANLADKNLIRAKELLPKGAISKSDYDANEAEYLTKKADIAVAEANIEQAKAKLAIADAALIKAQRNLDYCFINSPVDGVIIDRRVSVGQTLVSNMSASSIFLIAKDLKKMQVWATVNEADIGAIKHGMPVKFTVDAFGDMEFVGQVHKIRLNATMSQNVVTYVVEISTDNSSGKLLPYLTANVKFIRNSRNNALAVSNAALRYIPPQKLQVSGSDETIALVEKEKAEFAEKQQLASGKNAKRPGLIWIQDGKKLRPLRVEVGLNDGRKCEISGADVKENMVVVNGAVEVSAQSNNAAGEQGKNPFMPTPPKRRSNNPNAAAK